TITASEVTAEPPPTRSYAFCTDTLPLESTIEHVRGVDCLYHEATFLEKDANRAAETYHSTSRQAASIAKSAGVGKLLIGHYSARYKQLDEHLAEARSVFQ